MPFRIIQDIISDIRLPDYKSRHAFTARFRLLIFIIFWFIFSVAFKGKWEGPLFIPISLAAGFLMTAISYSNILRRKAYIPSFFLEILADIFCITVIVYITGGVESYYYSFYFLYALTAGVFYSTRVALFVSSLAFVFYLALVLLLYFNAIPPFVYPVEETLLYQYPSLKPFLNLIFLTVIFPVVVYGTKIANDFARIKEIILEDRNRQLLALHRISSAIRGVLSLEKIVRKVIAGGMEGLGYDICFLALFSRKDQSIVFYAPRHHEFTKKIELILGFPISSLKLPHIQENFVFQAMRKNGIVFQDNLYELVRGIEPPIPEKLAQRVQRSLKFRKFVVTPLMAERRVVGALIGASREEFVEDTRVDVLENFGNHAALAIESAQLFEELRQKNIDLEQANKIKTEFLAIMSHELRTPLTAVIGYSELLLEEVAGELNLEQKEYLNEVIRNSDHLLQLINSILDLSRVESGKMSFTVEAFDLIELIENLAKMIQPLVKKKDLHLELDFAQSLPKIEADPRKVKQIILNLLSNAIKFTPEGGNILVQVRYSPTSQGLWLYPSVRDTSAYELGYFKISVEDTGIGMKKEDLEIIFDLFSQVDSSYTRKYQGAGLGLTLTKRFVEMHGGVIWAESEYQQGSKFTFILPAKSIYLKESEL